MTTSRQTESSATASSSAQVRQSLSSVRVIGVYAHIDAGKTTTSEAILYLTGRIHRAGSVDDGNTQLDWMEQERERGITISAAATTCVWRACQIHLIDTPGHIDFTAEVMRSIRVIDGAVVVMCGVGGVETQTETVWRHADNAHANHRLPRLIFVNKLDRDTADFSNALSATRRQLTPDAIALQLPIGSGETFRGVVDLLERRALVWINSAPEPQEQSIPAELAEPVERARAALLDAICETDETLLEQRLEGREPGLDDLRSALRRATVSAQLVPVLCGSARRRIGIQPLLDAITAYLPAPLDTPPMTGELPGSLPAFRSPDLAEPFCASVFKIVTDPHVGHLAWVRVFSGRLALGEPVLNPRTNDVERVGRIYRIHANRREHVTGMQVGDVVALVGIKSAITGDTLCQPGHPILLEPYRFPQPVISVALSPTCDEERDRLHECAGHLCEEDPTLVLGFDSETGEQILSGMGELHLEVTIERLRREYNLLIQASPLQIAYRETVTRRSEATGNYRRQTGGHGHFAVARLRVEPLPRGDGIDFRSTANPIEVPDPFVRAIEAGAREALEKGLLAGYPLTDLRMTLTGGRYHEIDSNSLDFRIAGSMAVRQAVLQAGLVLLEPIMAADITTAEEYLGAVLGDFTRRRGVIGAFKMRGHQRGVLGEAPLAEMRGYATDLRNMTQGRGAFTLEFRHYEIVPERLATEIIQQRRESGKLTQR